ncbi:unnamed protein product, partial [Symbiodinium sp. CCMP2592]
MRGLFPVEALSKPEDADGHVYIDDGKLLVLIFASPQDRRVRHEKAVPDQFGLTLLARRTARMASPFVTRSVVPRRRLRRQDPTIPMVRWPPGAQYQWLAAESTLRMTPICQAARSIGFGACIEGDLDGPCVGEKGGG